MTRTKKPSITRQIKKVQLANIETNVLETPIAMTGTSISGDLDPVSVLVEGVASNQRVGAKVYFSKIIAKFIITSQDPTNKTRLMLVSSKGRPLVVGDMPSFYGCPNRRIFNVHYDKTFITSSLVDGYTGTFYPEAKYGSFSRSVKKNIVYEDTAGTLANNLYYLYTVTDSAVSGPTIYGCVSIFFKDL